MLRIFITPEQLLHIPTFPPRHRDGLKLRTIHSLVKYHIVVVVVLVKQSFNCYFTSCHVDYSLFFQLKRYSNNLVFALTNRSGDSQETDLKKVCMDARKAQKTLNPTFHAT